MLWLAFLAVAIGGGLTAYFLGRSDGAHGEKLKQVGREIDAAERVRDAAEKVPVTRTELVDRLRNGGL